MKRVIALFRKSDAAAPEADLRIDLRLDRLAAVARMEAMRQPSGFAVVRTKRSLRAA